MIRTYYVGPEEPANAFAFTDIFLGKAGELLPHLFEVQDSRVENKTRGKISGGRVRSS
jgi:hypothetical protein